MAKITVEEQKDLTLLPTDSIIHLKVDEIDVKEIDGRHGKWEKLEFKFKVLGIQAVGDGSSPEAYEDLIAGPIWGSVPFRLTDSPENKLRQWAEAILGMELGVGYELDTDLFLNRECRGITTQYDKRSKDAQGNPFKGHQVDSLLPKQGYAQQAPTQQYAAPQQYAQPQQGYAQPGQQQDPWSTPGQPAQPAVQDPWGAPGVGSDEPPF